MNQRYLRHIQLEEIGQSGQQKLTNAKVLVVGAGGLGCPLLQYLATSGVGLLGIVDPDTISISNLHRQILYAENDLGHPKVEVAKTKLQALSPEISVQAYEIALNEQNCIELIEPYDIVVDATDNFRTRYLINDACIILNKPMVFGALFKFEGQVSVFNYKNGPSYRCLFPNEPTEGEVPNCNEIGVLGVLPGIIGLLQANEVIKIILNLGDILSGKVLFLNTLTNNQRILKFSKNEAIINQIKNQGKPKAIALNDCIFSNSISLKDINDKDKMLWIDVRELQEQPQLNVEHLIKMPLSTFETDKLPNGNGTKKVFFCQSGVRSHKAVQLASEKGIANCYSLHEGAEELNAYLKEKE